MNQKEFILIATLGFATIFIFELLQKMGINNTYAYFGAILAITVIATTWYNRS
jgi:hypothetical protein